MYKSHVIFSTLFFKNRILIFLFNSATSTMAYLLTTLHNAYLYAMKELAGEKSNKIKTKTCIVFTCRSKSGKLVFDGFFEKHNFDTSNLRIHRTKTGPKFDGK